MADFPSGIGEGPIELATIAPFELGAMRVIPAERAVDAGETRRDGLRQTSDTGAIDAAVAKVLADNPDKVEQYKAGKRCSTSWSA